MAATVAAVGTPVASTSNASSYAMTAFTPTANALLVVVASATGTTTAAPTMTGGSLTWTRRLHQAYNSSADQINVFTAQVGGSPASTAPTFDCTGDAATGCNLIAFSVTGHDQSNPIAQSTSTTATGTNPSVTRSASNTNNAYIAAWAAGLAAGASTPPTGWTEQGDIAYTTPAGNAAGAFRNQGETSTSVTFTAATSTYGIVYLEIQTPGPISGTAAATGGQSGSLTGAGALAGSSAATAGSAATLTGDGALAGTSAATFGASSTLTGTGAVSGQSDATFGQSGDLQGSGNPGAISGSSAAAFGQSGTISGAGSLAATTAGTFGQTGTAAGFGALSGNASVVGGSSAALTGKGALAGTGAAAFGQSGALLGLLQASGTSPASFGQDGLLSGVGALLGSSSQAANQTGTLTGLGALSGSSAATFGQLGNLTTPGALSGTAAAVFGQSAALTVGGGLSGPPPTSPGSYAIGSATDRRPVGTPIDRHTIDEAA